MIDKQLVRAANLRLCGLVRDHGLPCCHLSASLNVGRSLN